MFLTMPPQRSGAFDFGLWQTGGGKGNPLPFEASCFVGYWDKVNTSLSNSGTGNSKKELLIDGHSFMGRMAVYKYLIENTNDKIWGPNFSGHFLWGYGALLDWEARSGRLNMNMMERVDGANNDVPADTISPKSWWGYMNFMFSVSILLGAVEAGVLDDKNMKVKLVDAHSQNLVQNDPIVRESIRLWKIFWADAFTLFSERVVTLLHDESCAESVRKQKMDVLYDQMNESEWKAHCAIFKIAVFDGTNPTNDKLLLEMTEPERTFSVGFCKIVDMLAALNVRTDLITTSENGVGYMPLRMLDKSMMKEINHGGSSTQVSWSPIEKKRIKIVKDMHKLYDLDKHIFGSIVSFWKRVGQWRYPRKNVGPMFYHLTHGSALLKLISIGKVLFFFALPASKIEQAVWTALGASFSFCYSLVARRAS